MLSVNPLSHESVMPIKKTIMISVSSSNVFNSILISNIFYVK